jgi:exonuclease VII large subunit
MASDGDGLAVKSVAALHPTDTVQLSFADGEATATIIEIKQGEQS